MQAGVWVLESIAEPGTNNWKEGFRGLVEYWKAFGGETNKGILQEQIKECKYRLYAPQNPYQSFSIARTSQRLAAR